MNKLEGKPFIFLWILTPLALGVLYETFRGDEVLRDMVVDGILYYVLFFSILIHEISHGLASEACGDPTAREAGRLTLNPIKHVSLVGSIIVPLLLFYFKAGFIIGWAKGVPYNPARLNRFPRDEVFLSFMGPMSNFITAGVCFFIFIVLSIVYSLLFPEDAFATPLAVITNAPGAVLDIPTIWFLPFQLLYMGVLVNIVLGVFNLIPFPPLDGASILKAVLPKKAVAFYNKFQIFGFILIILAVQAGLLEFFLYPVLIALLFLRTLVEIIFS